MRFLGFPFILNQGTCGNDTYGNDTCGNILHVEISYMWKNHTGGDILHVEIIHVEIIHVHLIHEEMIHVEMFYLKTCSHRPFQFDFHNSCRWSIPNLHQQSLLLPVLFYQNLHYLKCHHRSLPYHHLLMPHLKFLLKKNLVSRTNSS